MSSFLHRARFRMDHRWAPDRMSDYLDDELPSGGRARLEHHVGECLECRRVLAGLRAMLQTLHGLPAGGDQVEAVRIATAVRSQLGRPPESS
jgi:anti-sigma factor RsiW